MANPKPKWLDLATLSDILDDALLWVMDRRDRVRRYALVVAIIFFAVGLVWAIHETPNVSEKVRLAPLIALLLIGAPLSTALNAFEMRAISRMAGQQMTWRASFEVTVFSSAANMLPLPGGVLTKLAAMKAHGIGFGTGWATIVVTFTLWGCLAFLYSAGALFFIGRATLGTGFLAISVALLMLCMIAAGKLERRKLLAPIALLRLLSLPLDAVRFIFATSGLGASVSFGQASIFAVASFTSSAVVIVPSGLGIGEAVVALLSPLVSLEPALGFLVASVSRLVWLAGLALTAGLTLLAFRLPASALRRDLQGEDPLGDTKSGDPNNVSSIDIRPQGTRKKSANLIP